MRSLLVDDLFQILSSETNTQEFLNYISKYQFTELTFYTGGPIETRVIPGKEAEFSKLLSKLRTVGVCYINIAIGSTGEMDRVMKFITSYSAKVEGFHLEYEWWNSKPRDFDMASSILKYIRIKGGDRRIGAYIGWPTQEEMTKLLSLVDCLFMHAYVANGSTAYNYLKSRLDLIYAAKPTSKIPIYPIFSAETAPPDTIFMGQWLKANRGVIGAETVFNEKLLSDIAANWQNSAVIRGTFYYSYHFMKQVLP